MTDPERWRLAQSLFLDVLELAPEARADWLAQMCRNDSETLVEVKKLLRGHAADENVLSEAIGKAAHEALADGWTATVGQRIGAYEIVEPLGHGGMGSVYLAERADDVYSGKVAIKIVQRGGVTPEVAARFRLERQILAQMEHPNIARLLDGGTTGDGLPYLVMEYIEGEPLTDYCETKGLNLHQRLQLFEQLCAAVGFAHQRLIVHRDLKPGNILVTNDGVPKLLDFGIAKLLQPISDLTAAMTHTRMAPMSPEFAAPEQVSGGPISTATDVYGLGVLLYMLLTGIHPLRFDATRPDQIYRAIGEQEPSPPSSAAARFPGDAREPNTPARSPRGDLDRIVMMALRKEPERRYASVDQFAEDIKRYRLGLPVRAHEDSWSYRTSRFIARHKSAMAVALLIAAFLVGFLVREAGLRRQAELARAAASEEAGKAQAVSNFLRDMLKEANPWQATGREVTVVEALDVAARKLEGETDAFQERPELEAALRTTLAETYSGLGKYKPSLAHARQVLALRRTHLGETHPDTLKAQTLVARQLALRKKHAEAEKLFRDVLARATPTLGDTHDAIIAARAGLAATLNALNKFQEAETLALGVLADLARKGKAETSRAAEYTHNLGSTYYSMGEYAKALDYFEKALALRRRIHGERHPGTQSSLGNVAMVRLRMGKAEESRELFTRQIETLEQVLGAGHEETLEARHRLAATFFAQRDFVAAEKHFQQVTESRREAVGGEHPQTLSSLGSWAATLVYQGKYAQGEPLMREVYQGFLKNFGARHSRTLLALSNLAETNALMGNLKESENLHRRALQGQREVLGKHHPATLLTFENLTDGLEKQRRHAEAVPLLLELLQAYKNAKEPDAAKKRESMVRVRASLARVYTALGETEKASAYIEPAQEKLTAPPGMN